MNYWKQFAEMLGLELGQEFELIDDDGKRKDEDTYKVTEYGIYYKEAKTGVWHDEPPATSDYILNGDYKAVPKPWNPKNGDRYWFYSVECEEENSIEWQGRFVDLLLWKVGNCFKTKGEAKAKGKEIMEQIQNEFEEEQKC